jgi:hypothetical protein
MKTCWILVLLCFAIPSSAIPASALSGNMLRATVHAMRKVPCTEITGAPVRGGFGGATEEWCLEYELRTESVSYVIRPHHMILLLLGGDVSIRLAGGQLLLHTNESPKDIRCDVLAMTLRSEQEKQERDKDREREREHNRPYAPGCYNESGTEIPCQPSDAWR